ncbi:hypothetical protein GCM10025789_09140 [Tessaracoccus lubricantis]|uniref:TMhelix containing protein n=1 Tax=Tessaracoccus lubricantis TaxID=545543 RepID=A0ABP9F4G8_9ACTN
MSSEAEQPFDVEKYEAEHKKPSEVESAVLTILLFASMVVFTVGCVMLDWFK